MVGKILFKAGPSKLTEISGLREVKRRHRYETVQYVAILDLEAWVPFTKACEFWFGRSQAGMLPRRDSRVYVTCARVYSERIISAAYDSMRS